jgi:hypothetical protein
LSDAQPFLLLKLIIILSYQLIDQVREKKQALPAKASVFPSIMRGEESLEGFHLMR